MTDDLTNDEKLAALVEPSVERVLLELRVRQKIDWGIIIGLVTTIIVSAFTAGISYANFTAQAGRIDILEVDRKTDRQAITPLTQTLTKIEQSTKFLEERAKEDRQVIYQRRGL